ncbi:MAG: hypothetical protein ACJAVT_000680 [Yoonia sp.]|jgi:uncharacterized protein (DUF2267 family)
MSAQGLEVIDHTVHLTHEWINELADRLDWTSARDVLRLMRSTLRAIRDHLRVDETAQFSAQLPLLIRVMYFEGWVPKTTPIKERHLEDFVSRIEVLVADVKEYRGAADIQAVLKMLNARISRGEVEDIRANLPT